MRIHWQSEIKYRLYDENIRDVQADKVCASSCLGATPLQTFAAVQYPEMSEFIPLLDLLHHVSTQLDGE